MRIACFGLVILLLCGCSAHPKHHTQSVKQVVSPAAGGGFSSCAPGMEQLLQSSLKSDHSLELSAKPISHECYDQMLAWLNKNPHLTSLSMVQMGLSDVDLIDLLYYLDQSPIKRLILSENNLTDASMSALQGYLANSSSLSEIDLSNNPIGSIGACIIADGLALRHASKLNALKRLDLSATGLDAEGLNCLFAEVSALPQAVSFSNNDLQSWQLDMLPEVSLELEELNLNGVTLNSKAMASIVSIVQHQQGLEVLNFSENTLSRSQFQSLMDAVHKHPALQILNVAFSMKPDFEKMVNEVLADKPTLRIQVQP